MSRYIDADKLKDTLFLQFADEEENAIEKGAYWSSKVVREIIDEQPTADVVEVVRCKDCIHGTKDFDKFLCEWNQEYHNGDWFCADGERRENAT